MKSKPEMITPSQVVGIVLKRRWFILLPLLAAVLVGIYLVLTLPMVYKADTLILIQPQKVPGEFVRSVVSTDIDARLNTISQQILSRSNLEKIIEQFKLFSDPKYDKMYMEDKIAGLRKRISVDLIRADRRKAADAFSISFKGQDPRQVATVANGLARYFMDENMKVRETQALGTSDFLEDELVTIRQQLEEQEEALKKYRETNMGGLPEQLDTNLRILEGLQFQHNTKSENLRNVKNNLMVVEKQIEEEETLKDQEGQGEGEEGEASSVSQKTEDEIKLEQMKDALETLKLNYTEKHPDIVRLNKMIQELEGKVVEEAGNEAPGDRRPEQSDEEIEREKYRYAVRDELRFQITTLTQEIKKLERQMAYYQNKVEDTPKREQELLSLKRDYQNIKSLYDSILARKLESDISVNMEKKQKGEQFRILDAAHVPHKPSEPDMNKLFIMVIGAGLGIGGGFIFLLERLDTSFRKAEAVEDFLELPVLATIPRLYQTREIRLRRLNLVASLLVLFINIGLVGGFAALTFNGVEPTVKLVKSVIPI